MDILGGDIHTIVRPQLLDADVPGYHGYCVCLGRRSEVEFWQKLENFYAVITFRNFFNKRTAC
jgi:ABC-type microcin C transport system permease subunit YejE